jgi:YVTN family beta-propeller protein
MNRMIMKSIAVYTTTLSLIILTLCLVQPGQSQNTPSPALLVGEKSGALLAIVDPVTLEIVARVPANPNPHEVATDGRYAYVTNSGAEKITVIDLMTQSQVEGIDLNPLSSIHGIWMAGGNIYFANERSRTIARYHPESEGIDWVLGTGQKRSHMLMVSEDESTIFATNMDPGSVSIIEYNEDDSDWDITVIETGARAEGLDLSPDGSELWVTNVYDSTISVIDTETKRVVSTIDLPTNFSNRLKFTPDGKYVFVAELRGTELLILDAVTRESVKRIDVGGGSEGMQMSPQGDRAFIAVSTINTVAVIDLETLEVSATIEGFNNPDGMTWVD